MVREEGAGKGPAQQAPRRAADPTAWLTGYRRLTIRYERHAHLFAAFLSLAAAITCFKKLAT